MASRQNREARQDAPSYGAPLGPPPVDIDREAERKKKLEEKASPEERRRLIEEHESRGQEETAKARDRRTDAPKPTPYERVGETTGKTPARIIAERPDDVSDAIDRAEGVEPVRDPEVDEPETTPERPLRVRPPKQQRK